MRLNEAGSSWTAKDYGIAVLLVGSGLFAWGLLMYVSFKAWVWTIVQLAKYWGYL